MGIEIGVEETRQLEEGKHTGRITKVEQATRGKQGYKYIDVFVKPDGEDNEIKAGYPATVAKGSMLGKLAERFGAVIAVGTKIDIEGLLLNKQVSFVTINEESERGTFARIQRESLKPAGA